MSDGRLEKLHQEPFVKIMQNTGPVCQWTKRQFQVFYRGRNKRHADSATYDVYEVNSQSYAVFTTPKANNDNFSQNPGNLAFYLCAMAA